jgi:hypothetical protein
VKVCVLQEEEAASLYLESRKDGANVSLHGPSSRGRRADSFVMAATHRGVGSCPWIFFPDTPEPTRSAPVPQQDSANFFLCTCNSAVSINSTLRGLCMPGSRTNINYSLRIREVHLCQGGRGVRLEHVTGAPYNLAASAEYSS